MSNFILAVKAIIAIQQLLQGLLDSIVESRKEDERQVLKDALMFAKTAKTKEEKIEAAKKIESAFSRG